MVIGHYDCGMSVIDGKRVMKKMTEKGIPPETLSVIENSGIDLNGWLQGFDCVDDSVKESVRTIKNHPLLPPDIPVHGLLIDPATGRLDVVVNGYDEVK